MTTSIISYRKTLAIRGGGSGLPRDGAGDGGKTVFEDDKDRYGWVDLIERACGRFGWRVYAWVLMGNDFHLLIETPEPNLVAGMKWLLGVYSQGPEPATAAERPRLPRALQGIEAGLVSGREEFCRQGVGGDGR